MVSSTEPALILKEGPKAGETFELQKPETTLGREPGVDWVIESPGVSRRHARFSFEGDTCLLEDLGSSNGTYVNGVRITNPVKLNNGDEIKLGQAVVLTLLLPVTSATVMESPPTEQRATILEQSASHSTMMEKQQGMAATMIGEDLAVSMAALPPHLMVTVAGEKPVVYTLSQSLVRIGRGPDNEISIDSRIVSRSHARIERTVAGYLLTVLPEAGNPIQLDGRPLTGPHILKDGDLLRIGSLDPGLMVTLTFSQPVAMRAEEMRPIRFGEKNLIQIGRDPSNDVVLDSPTVSRFHAQIERIGHRYRLRDLHSGNGTFVNDQRVDDREVWLNEADAVRIGRHRFVMKQDQLDQFDETRGLKVEAFGLNKWVRKDLNILQNISLSFQPRELIVVVGQSGGGKSTLIEAMIGYRPATQGQVLINGTNVYRNFDAVRNDMGFVPQRDIIHTGLTVYQALDYSARLRMPRDTTKEERHERIMQVLTDLDLLHRKDNPISKLSGGQIKRVSIGVELLTSPGLFFLDEPTSGLDPGTETAFMHLMRRLADQGRTIVMVTHATKNVMLADKVVFLARGGYLAWFGPPDEALTYFDSYRSEREQRARAMEFDQIYAILDDSAKGSNQEWSKRYMESAAYSRYIVEPLKLKEKQPVMDAAVPQIQKPAAVKVKPKRTASAMNQFLVLSARNLKILVRDKSSLTLMLLAAPLVAMLDFVIAPLMGRAPFDYVDGNAPNAAITLFLMTIYCLLVAGLSQMREFVKEEDIYKRERLVSLKILPYVASKIWVALLLAFYHAAAYTIIHFLAFDMPGGTLEFGLVYVTMVLAAMAGMVCGLLASALAPAASSAPMIMILLLVPQIVLSGALAPVPQTISSIASTRWAFQGLIGITGIGSDVAADTCWDLPEDLRDSMTLDDKAAMGCRCMGTAIFKPGSCNFPGVGKYYVPEVDKPAVLKPADLPPKPADPVIPTAPAAPADQNDQVEMVKYLNALQAYQDEVTLIQNDYKAQMELYESQAEVYQAAMEEYQKDVLTYETARNSAVERAEGVINSVIEEFGWGFVNKDDSPGYRSFLTMVWGGQGVLIVLYIAIILFFIKRKDG